MGVETATNKAQLNVSSSKFYRPSNSELTDENPSLSADYTSRRILSSPPEKHSVRSQRDSLNEVTNQSSKSISSPEADDEVKQKRTRERRPDRAVYVPRARRSQTVCTVVSSAPADTKIKDLTNAKIKKHTVNSSRGEKHAAATTNSTSTPSSVIINNLTCDKPSSNSPNQTDNLDKAVVVDSSCVQPLIIANNERLNEDYELPSTNSNSTDSSTPNTTAANSPLDTAPHQPLVFEIMDLMKEQQSQNGRVVTALPPPTIKASLDRQNSLDNDKKEDRDEKILRRQSQEMNRSNRRLMKQTFTSDILEICGDDQKVEKRRSKTKKTSKPASQPQSPTTKEAPAQLCAETDDWEAMFDDNGDCLDPKLMDELTTAVGKVKIVRPQSDYKLYQSKEAILEKEDYPHVLEASNFPVEFKTSDLMMIFAQYKESGFDIKWVDDTHALVIFSTSKIAAEVLAMGHPFVSLKPLAEASADSRSKAKKCSHSLQPYRPRPETCAALARRLVSGALGVKLKTAPEERENERKVLREAKERKLAAAKQRDEMWAD